MLGDFQQPARCWIADAIDNLNTLLKEGDDPSFTITMSGVVIEIRLNKCPGVFERVSIPIPPGD